MDAEIIALEEKLAKARHRSCREHARRYETAGQAGYDVRVVDPAEGSGAGREGEVGVRIRWEAHNLLLENKGIQ